MICMKCESVMYKDDVDMISKYDKDIYWNCPNCTASCIQQIRWNFPFAELWHSENDGVVEDWKV